GRGNGAGADAVEDDRGAGGALLRRRPERELVRALVADPAVLPAVVLVGDDPALGVDAGAHLGEMGRSVIVPAVLVGAHELHAHRTLDRLRQDRRRLCRILVAAVAEGAGALVVLYAHL